MRKIRNWAPLSLIFCLLLTSCDGAAEISRRIQGLRGVTAEEDEFIVSVELDVEDKALAPIMVCFIDDVPLAEKNYVTEEDSIFCFHLRPEDFKEITDISKLSAQFLLHDFTDRTSGFTDAEPMIDIPAEYGEVYGVRISGSEEEGFRAEYLGKKGM